VSASNRESSTYKKKLCIMKNIHLPIKNSSFKYPKSPGDPDRWRVDEIINNNSETDGENDNNGISKNGNFSFKSKSSSAKLQLVAIGNNLGKNKRPWQW